MTRQIGAQYQPPQVAELEQRVHNLEFQVDTLTEALRVLTRGLEDGPLDEPGGHAVVDAARFAHDLLLAAEMPLRAGGDEQDGPATMRKGGLTG